MKIKTLFYLLLLPGLLSAQLLEWEPAFPTADDTITIIYDATRGSAGLVGEDVVYAHTGVITDKSDSPSAWRYVKTNWGENTPETRLTPLGNDRWMMRFHIRSYYGVPETETIEQLAFVFRSADAARTGKTADGGDIFLPIYTRGLNVSILSPAQTPVFLNAGDTLNVKALATQAERIVLRLNGVEVAASSTDTLDAAVVLDDIGRYDVEVAGARHRTPRTVHRHGKSRSDCRRPAARRPQGH